MVPKIIEERKLWEQGYRFVACVDEAGRGPLAGPVVAAAVCFTPKLSLTKENLVRLSFPRLKDSKQLSLKRREEIYKKVARHPALRWGIGKVYPSTIDRINIYNATKLAMKRALLGLEKKLQHKNRDIAKISDRRFSCRTDFLIVDGNQRLSFMNIPCKAIIKGDEKVFSCALASIVAKVTRDRMMVRYHAKYPQYGFDRHKGYGTRLHLEMLKLHGACVVHRKTFGPVRSCEKNKSLLE